MDPLIVTVAAVGAELTREQQPYLPISPDELATDAAQCAEAGASIYHLHVRDAQGQPTMDVETFRRAHGAITSATDLIVQFTTGGSTSDDGPARLAPLQLKPEMATLTTGSVNFGSEVFLNPAPLLQALYESMRALGVMPEFEIFEAGMIANATRLVKAGGFPEHLHFDLVLGVPGALPAWPDAVSFLSSHLPEGSSWTATGIGRSWLEVARTSIKQGGHVRTGFEDVLHLSPGVVAPSNRRLVEEVVSVARSEDRPLATPAQAREILGLLKSPGQAVT